MEAEKKPQSRWYFHVGDESVERFTEVDGMSCILFLLTILVESTIESIHPELIGIAVRSMIVLALCVGGWELFFALAAEQFGKPHSAAFFSAWTFALVALLALSGWAVQWGAWSIH